MFFFLAMAKTAAGTRPMGRGSMGGTSHAFTRTAAAANDIAENKIALMFTILLLYVIVVPRIIYIYIL